MTGIEKMKIGDLRRSPFTQPFSSRAGHDDIYGAQNNSGLIGSFMRRNYLYVVGVLENRFVTMNRV